jgi:glucose uptake protein GlcU
LVLIIMQIFHRNTPYFVLNVSIAWKCAFTVGLIITALTLSIQYGDKCFAQCITMHVYDGCVPECPVYISYLTKNEDLYNIVIFNLSQLCILIVIRSFTLCFYHNKKLKFLEFEEVPLLSPDTSV